MSRILWRSSIRYLLHHPWQIGLSLLGVALGVAVVVSIDLANRSAERAFSLSTASVVGRTTHQIVGGSTGLPEEVYRKLRVEEGISPAAPVVEGYVDFPKNPGRPLHLLGIDPFAEAPFRPYLSNRTGNSSVDLTPFLTQPNTGVLSIETAKQVGLQVGDSFTIQLEKGAHTLTLIGVLQPEDEMSKRALENLLVTDISTAQELLGLTGFLSYIHLILPEGRRGETMLKRIQTLLPPGAEVIRSASRSQAIEQMTHAFSLNLTALSLLALIVGMFLIYNTMLFSVVQRRTLIGTLRAMGVTRREVWVLVFGEALLIGGIGTIGGLGLGIFLGRSLVHLVTQTINDLYFVLSVRELYITPLSVLKGVVLGFGATMLAALIPAFEATTAPPRAVLTRSTIEQRLRRTVPRSAIAGLLLLLLGPSLFLIPSKNLLLSYGALFAMLLGCAFLTPAITILLMRLCQPLLSVCFGILGRMSARGVVASLSRTAVAIAALMIAVATVVGVGIMIGSFRQTVVRWLETSLQADIYISPASLIHQKRRVALDPDFLKRLTVTPGVESVSTYRGIVIESETGLNQVVALGLERRGFQAFQFKAGDSEVIWPAFQEEGAVIISEPYAYHHRLQVGSTVRLRTDYGEQDFRIAGIFYDYGSDQGVVMMSRRTYNRFWNDRAVSSLGVYAAPGWDIDTLVESLRRLAANTTEQALLIRSNRALRELSLEVFDRTFAITAVLRLLAIIVACTGVLSALMALQLERVRELGVLRATGLTPRQVWGLVTTQTGLMGLVAGLLAIPVGIVLALVLIFVINRRSFGWTLQMEIAPEMLIQAVLLALLSAIAAGLYPAWRMARTAPALALREE